MSDLLTDDGLERFGAVAAAHVGDEKVPGLVALVARGDQVHVETVGSLSIGGPPVRRDSLFRISSTTKPVTGAATLAVVREGLLGLDERGGGGPRRGVDAARRRRPGGAVQRRRRARARPRALTARPSC